MTAMIWWAILIVWGCGAVYVAALLTWYGWGQPTDQRRAAAMPWWWIFAWPGVIVGLTLLLPFVVIPVLWAMVRRRA